MKIYDRICSLLSNVMIAICCIFMMIILCSSSLQVISRYVVSNSVTWTEEASRYSFIWMSFLGAASLAYKGGHASVDLIAQKIKGKAKTVYQTVIYIAVIYVGFILMRYGYQLSKMTMKQTSSSLKLPMGLVYGAIPICGVFVVLFSVNLLIHVWKDRNETRGGNS